MKKIEVINYFGNVKNTAHFLGISHAAVCKWKSVIPEKRAMQIERLTKGLLIYFPYFYQKSKTKTD
ncbi:hypothetical protein CJJ19_02675 [Candidatus Williamhamiltonella defendens]|nr:Cro/CI family transcriptional regulator [Candidatus Hamiltonella defensa]AYB48573.1 hypothetical protein CJJ19_02675 [Candidatus Hamiltonella defensa]